MGVSVIYLPRTDGQGLVEYALILLFIAIAVIAIVTLFGEAVTTAYSRVVSMWPA